MTRGIGRLAAPALFGLVFAAAPAPAMAQVSGGELLRWCQGALSTAPTALSDAFQCTTYLQAVLDEVQPPGALDRCLGKPGLTATDLMAHVLPVLEAAAAAAGPDGLTDHAREVVTGWMEDACAMDDPLGDRPAPQAPQATECDLATASSGDPGRVAEPVEYLDLNPPRAIRACREALEADPGNLRLLAQLGRALEKAGQYRTSEEANRAAAEAGWPQGFHNLGNLYRKGGPDFPQDLERAAQYYRQAAELGQFESQYNLGVMYLDGVPFARDDAEARRWFERSAEGGWPPAIDRLAGLYRAGRGVEQDLEEAYRLYLRAADLQRATAMVSLGEMYLRGEAVPQDVVEARHWFERAADLENHAAYDNLGNLYRDGLGVDADIVEACKWFRLAAGRGNTAARRKLDDLTRDLDESLIEESDRRVRAWLNRRWG